MLLAEPARLHRYEQKSLIIVAIMNLQFIVHLIVQGKSAHTMAARWFGLATNSLSPYFIASR